MRPKRMTRQQKRALGKAGVDPKEYHLLFDIGDQVILAEKKNPDRHLRIEKPAGW